MMFECTLRGRVYMCVAFPLLWYIILYLQYKYYIYCIYCSQYISTIYANIKLVYSIVISVCYGRIVFDGKFIIKMFILYKSIVLDKKSTTPLSSHSVFFFALFRHHRFIQFLFVSLMTRSFILTLLSLF